jgi:hypothetical protein
MDPTWRRMNVWQVRAALVDSTDGQSGRYVYAKASSDGREFRITSVKTHRGLTYGLELQTGKWVVIGQWQER